MTPMLPLETGPNYIVLYISYSMNSKEDSWYEKLNMNMKKVPNLS